VVREFGKEVIHSKGDCLACDYFEEFFGSYSKSEQLNERHEAKSEKATTNKKNFLYYFAYGVGRGIQGVKGKVTDIKEVFGGKSSKTKQMENSTA
jgi:hypothetical protein